MPCPPNTSQDPLTKVGSEVLDKLHSLLLLLPKLDMTVAAGSHEEIGPEGGERERESPALQQLHITWYRRRV